CFQIDQEKPSESCTPTHRPTAGCVYKHVLNWGSRKGHGRSDCVAGDIRNSHARDAIIAHNQGELTVVAKPNLAHVEAHCQLITRVCGEDADCREVDLTIDLRCRFFGVEPRKCSASIWRNNQVIGTPKNSEICGFQGH